MAQRNSHCCFCGASFDPHQGWPRHCGACNQMSYLNPTPVAVLLLPVDAGLMVIRRGIEPQYGALALPGGFVDLGETWQEAAIRELEEETYLRLDPAKVEDVYARSAGGTILIFGRYRERISSADLPAFEPTDETLERQVLTAPEPLAFPLHTEAAKVFFEQA